MIYSHHAVSILVSMLAFGGSLRAAEAPVAPATTLLKSALRDVQFVLTRDGKPLGTVIGGRLFDERGEVTDENPEKSRHGRGPLFGENGEANFRVLPGRYDLWIVPRGEVPGKIFRGLVVGAAPKINAAPQKFELSLPVATTIRGRLRLPNGKSAKGYIVSVQSATEPEPFESAGGLGWGMEEYARGAQNSFAQALVGADGTWILSGLAPGTYQLDVRRKISLTPFCSLEAPPAFAGKVVDMGDVTVPQNEWEWLFKNGLGHGGAASKFFGQGEIKFDREWLELGEGKDLTGVTWTENLPRVNYEITLDAMRAGGNDFFCGLTFPVGDKPLSWILGGWGGTIVGLSSIDGLSAEENETTKIVTFDSKRWYRVRLRVTAGRIEGWIDGEPLLNFATAGKQLSIRSTVEPSQPLGIATWRTTGRFRDIRIRRLDADEISAIDKATLAQALP